MEKIIKIGDQEVKLSNNLAWTMEYKNQFGKDIIPTIMPLVASFTEAISTAVANSDTLDIKSIAEAFEGRSMDILLPMFQTEFVDIVINVIWAMAKAADESIDPPQRWIRQFDAFPLDEIIPATYKMVVMGLVSSKNLARLKSIEESLKRLQPSTLMTSSSQDSNED